VWAHSTPRIRAHNVRPLVAICNRWRGHANGKTSVRRSCGRATESV
jgi:hypothetical protein